MTPLYTQPTELAWGALSLDAPVAPDIPWLIETMANSASLGNPEPLREVVESMLTDGSLSVTTSYGNRQVTFRVRISAPDGIALAQGVESLMAEVTAERPSPLVWTPPSGDAWPCVFDVVAATYEADYSDGWDSDEVMHACAYFTLTLECLPWVHGPETVTIPALEVPEEPDDPALYEVIDSCDSTVGWTGIRCHSAHWSTPVLTSGTDADGTWVRSAATLTKDGTTSHFASMGVIRPGAVSLAGLPYLTVDVKTQTSGFISEPNSPIPPVLIVVSGSPYYPIAVTPLSNGRWRYYFQPPNSFSNLGIRGYWRLYSTYGGTVQQRDVKIWEIGRTDRIESADATGRQVARTATVGGTAPTQATVRFATALGDTTPVTALMDHTGLIYTGSTAAVALRPAWVSSASVLPNATTVSGSENDLSTPAKFRIPVSQLTEANYGLFARLEFTGSKTINWSARLVSSAGADIPGSEVVESGSMMLTNSSLVWSIKQLGVIPMPILDNLDADSTHMVELTLSMTSGGDTVTFDDGWLLNDDNGAVTIINTEDYAGLYKIELRSPQLDSPRPAVVGTWLTHGSQDISRLVERMGTHLFKPGTLHVFTVADGMKYALCELEYFERFHTRPGPAYVSESA